MTSTSSESRQPSIYQFIIKNNPQEVTRLSQWINDTFAPAFQLSPKLVYQLDLILEEAITNIIAHAFDKPGIYDIAIMLQVDTATITIQVIDSGKPFNPLRDHQIELPTKLDNAGLGGLGIHLIRSYTRECQYQRMGDKNLFTMLIDIT